MCVVHGDTYAFIIKMYAEYGLLSFQSAGVCVVQLVLCIFSTRPLNAYNVRVYMNTYASYFDENESCQ